MGVNEHERLSIFTLVNRFITVPHFIVRFMVLNATFNNISVISWRSVLLVEETGVPGENH
jgi:hypothetical protein